jgi:hypothetical protein
MSAFLEFGLFAFSTLGSQPHPTSRRHTFERDDLGKLRKAKARITLEGIILPDPALTLLADMQDSITQRRAALEALISAAVPTGSALRFIEDDGVTVSWQYGGADPTGASPNAVWYPTTQGVKIVEWGFDKKTDVEHATLQSYSITFECMVDAECVAGADACSYRTTETFQNGVITSVSYSGWIRVCDGDSCSDEIDALIDDLRDEATTLLGLEEPAPITSKSKSTNKDDESFCEFSVTFGLSSGESSGAERLIVNASLSIEHNTIQLEVTGKYTYSSGQRAAVLNQARRLDGVDINDYLPSGAVAGIHVRTRLTVDEASRTITSTHSVTGHWTHHGSILRIDETISIARPMPNTTVVKHAWLPGATAPPACTIHTGGLGAYDVRISGSITSLGAYQDVSPRYTPDYALGPIQVEAYTAEPQSLTPDVEGSLSTEDIYLTRYSQRWLHPGPAFPTPIPITSIFSVTVTPLSEV